MASIPETCVTFGANTVNLIPSMRHQRLAWLEQLAAIANRNNRLIGCIKCYSEKARGEVLKAMVGCGMKDEPRYTQHTGQLKATLAAIENGTHHIKTRAHLS